MLLIGLGIGIMVAGIFAIVRGRIQFSKTRAVQGVAARLLGVALLAPLPAGFLAATIYTLAHVDPNNPDQVREWGQQNDATITGVMAGTMIGLAVLIIAIAAVLAKPIDGPRRKRRDDFDEDERERPRRRAELDEDDDRPRRRGDDLDERAR